MKDSRGGAKPGGGNAPGGPAPRPNGGGGAPGNPNPWLVPTAGPARPGIATPRPATGLVTPNPCCIPPTPPAATPPPDGPNRELGSAGGGPVTVDETIVAPRRMTSPSVRRSSVSTNAGSDSLDVAVLVALRLIRRNSSASARTTFMCWVMSVSQWEEKGPYVWLRAGASRDMSHLVKGQHLALHLSAFREGDAQAVVDL